jgi:D-hydroxyproline dehydrogenase subunit beta
MTNERHAVIGAGIVGLALARALARRGRVVTVLEADRAPQGASIRNVGTLWSQGATGR